MRPTLTALEDRILLSMYTVSNNDDSGAGSLRYEIGLANMAGGANTIVFGAFFDTPQTITLTSGQLELSSGTETITGPAAGVTVSGDGKSRVFQVDDGVTAAISGLTITGGNASEGGGIAVLGGSATITECTISFNTAQGNGGGA